MGIRYRVHERHHGWQGYLADGATAGNVEGTVLEALQVGLTNAPPNTFISVEPYIQDWGWSGYVRDNWEAGTTGQGRRMEGFRAYVRTGSPEPARVGVAYSANPRAMGYIGWKRNGEEAGTTGKQLPLDSFRVSIFNKPSGMKIEYRCWVQESDWQPWQDDATGECGLFGTNKAIYALEMRLVNAYPGSVLRYTAHVQNRGNLTWSSDDPGTNAAGTIGHPPDRHHVEAIRVEIENRQP